MIPGTAGGGSASWSCTAAQYSSVSDEPSCHVRRATSARSAGYEWAMLLVYRPAVPPTARGGSEHRGRVHEARRGGPRGRGGVRCTNGQARRSSIALPITSGERSLSCAGAVVAIGKAPLLEGPVLDLPLVGQ